MVVLIKKPPNFPNKSKKLEKSTSVALQSFQSNISEGLIKLFSGQKLGSVTLSWFIPCFKLIQGMNRAFAKLVKDLDYPLEEWDQNLADDYFSYSFSLLDGLNSISSSISHLGISKLKLFHALNLINEDHHHSAIHQHLKPIIPIKTEPLNFKEIKVLSFKCNKKRAIHEALIKLRSAHLLILRVLLLGTDTASCGGYSGLTEIRNEGLNLLGLGDFDVRSCGDGVLKIKEVDEVNEAVKKLEDCLTGGMKSKNTMNAAIELKLKLNELEKSVEVVEKEVNCLFSEVLAWRNKLIDCLRLYIAENKD